MVGQAVGVQQQDVAAAHQRPLVHLVPFLEAEQTRRQPAIDDE